MHKIVILSKCIKYNFMHFERHLAFRHLGIQIIFDNPENLKKIQVSPVNLGRVGLP